MHSSLPPPVSSLEVRLKELHAKLQAEYPEVTRIAVAVYDDKTDLLKTLVASHQGGANPLVGYDVPLADVPSLKKLADERAERVLNDLASLHDSPALHSKVVVEHYGSSYTTPLFEGGALRGFLFFDATCTGYFEDAVVQRLRIYADMVSLLVTNDYFAARMLRTIVRMVADVTLARDPETAIHLDRMSRYTRIVARGMALQLGLSDVYVEHLFLFAALHDIGKVAVPAEILFKPARLTDTERKVIQTHVTWGEKMVARLLDDMPKGSFPNAEMLTNVVLLHHEAYDGSGYPHGLRGGAIPLEARIVAVADVFDALTSPRPYKEPWPVEDAFAYMKRSRGRLFDPRCVDSLLANREQILAIKARFADESPSVFC